MPAEAVAVHHEVVIDAAAQQDLRVGRADARADQRRIAEVERGVVDRRELAGGNQSRIDRSESISVDLQEMIVDRSGVFSV